MRITELGEGMRLPPDLDRVREHLRTCCDTYKNYLRPLFKLDDREKPYHAGSCFAVKHGEQSYLVTASHVLDKHEGVLLDRTDEFWCVSNNKLQQVTKFKKAEISVPRPGSQSRVALDLVLIKPHDFDVSSIVPNHFTPKDILTDRLGPSQVTSASGFPTTKNKIRYNTTALTQIAYSYGGNVRAGEPEAAEVGVIPGAHFAFEMDIKQSFDALGNKRVAPDPSGVSGGPVFLIHDFRFPEQMIAPRLCGVAIEHDSKRKEIVCISGSVLREAVEQHADSNK